MAVYPRRPARATIPTGAPRSPGAKHPGQLAGRRGGSATCPSRRAVAAWPSASRPRAAGVVAERLLDEDRHSARQRHPRRPRRGSRSASRRSRRRAQEARRDRPRSRSPLPIGRARRLAWRAGDHGHVAAERAQIAENQRAPPPAADEADDGSVHPRYGRMGHGSSRRNYATAWPRSGFDPIPSRS